MRVAFDRLLNIYILLAMKLLPSTVPSLFVPNEKFDLFSNELAKFLWLSFSSVSVSFSSYSLPPFDVDLLLFVILLFSMIS